MGQGQQSQLWWLFSCDTNREQPYFLCRKKFGVVSGCGKEAGRRAVILALLVGSHAPWNNYSSLADLPTPRDSD